MLLSVELGKDDRSIRMGDLIESSRVAPLAVTVPEAKEMQPHSFSNDSSITFFRACFNGINTLLGLRILSTPYALSEGGWLSLILLFMIAIVCCYIGIQLQRCMKSNSLVKTYPDIRHLAFRYWGRLLISIFMYLELYLIAVEFLILEGDHFEKLFPSVNVNIRGLKINGKHGLVLIAALVILHTTWLRSVGLLAYVSIGEVLASGMVVGCVVWTGTFNGVRFHEKGRLVNWSGMPIVMSLLFLWSSSLSYDVHLHEKQDTQRRKDWMTTEAAHGNVHALQLTSLPFL